MNWSWPGSNDLVRLADPRIGLAAWRLWGSAAETAFYSAVTINARLSQIGMALMTGGKYPTAESWQMVSEKPMAAMESFMAAWRANARLATDPQALLRSAQAGLRPYRRKTRSNARRLGS